MKSFFFTNGVELLKIASFSNVRILGMCKKLGRNKGLTFEKTW